MKRIVLFLPLFLLSACSFDQLGWFGKQEEPAEPQLRDGRNIKAAVVAGEEKVVVRAPVHQGQLEFKLSSGLYQCERNMQVRVQRDSNDNSHIRIDWIHKEYQLTRDQSSSGLPRYEDNASGLVWIDLPWKSVLLDGRKNRPIASECVLAAK